MRIFPARRCGSNLVITTTGRTFTAATFPVTGFLNLLNGETLNTGAFSIQSNVTLTKSGPGTMNIDAVQTNGSNSGLSVTAGVVNVGTDAGSAGDAPLSLAASAAGVVHLNAPQHLHSLSATGGHVNVAAGGSNLIVADQVAASGGGAIDLRDNSMIVHGAAGAWNGASYTGVAGLIASGRNGGSWDGSGIVTSESLAVGPNALTTLAVASAADALHLGPGATTSWDGESISDSDTLVKYTYAGDADLSGRIDADDYFAIDSGYAHPANPSYASGDFNYDGAINGDDYFLIDSNYLAQTMTFAVPENLPVAHARGNRRGRGAGGSGTIWRRGLAAGGEHFGSSKTHPSVTRRKPAKTYSRLSISSGPSPACFRRGLHRRGLAGRARSQSLGRRAGVTRLLLLARPGFRRGFFKVALKNNDLRATTFCRSRSMVGGLGGCAGS